LAEDRWTGILTALLLFTALTVRDIYVGRSSVTQQDSTGPDLHTQRQNKHTLYTGPVLKFQFCKVFQEYFRSISQLYPDIRIEGENYPPKPINKYTGNFISYFKLLAITLIVTGQNPFQMFGVNTPRICWGKKMKVCEHCMYVKETSLFLSGLLDVPIWSKLQSGYVPSVQELFQILDNHLKMNQVDKINFPSP
uniref:Selenoprotein T n=1 Tax=Sinocyclocheilus anshuiensis TaxID=1608454 RepID=A0A671KBL2_9TELE